MIYIMLCVTLLIFGFFAGELYEMRFGPTKLLADLRKENEEFYYKRMKAYQDFLFSCKNLKIDAQELNDFLLNEENELTKQTEKLKHLII